MAVGLIGTTQNATSISSSVTINNPGNWLAGHIILAYFTSNNQNCTPPSGFVEIADVTSEVLRHQIFYKVCTGSEPADYTFSTASSTPMILTMNAWSEVDNFDPIDIDPVTETALTHSEPYTTPTLPGSGATSGRIMQVRVTRDTGTTPITFSESDSSYSERADQSSVGDSVVYSHGVYSQDYPGYNSDTSNKPGLAITASGTETHNIVVAFALKSEGNPGAMEAYLPLPEMTSSGSIAEPAVLAATLPLPTASIAAFNGNVEGSLAAQVPVSMSTTASVQPSGTMSAPLRLDMELEGETRRFADNVVRVEADKRWVIIYEDDILFVDGRNDVRASRELSIEITLPFLVWDPWTVIKGPHPILSSALANNASVGYGRVAGSASASATAYGAYAGIGRPAGNALVWIVYRAKPEPPAFTAASTAYDASVAIEGGANFASVYATDGVVRALMDAHLPLPSVAVDGGILQVIYGPLDAQLPILASDITAKKVNIVYAVTIGNGTDTSFTITHNLGSRDILTAVYEAASPYEEVQTTAIERTDSNTVTVRFPSAPTTNQYRVVVVYG